MALAAVAVAVSIASVAVSSAVISAVAAVSVTVIVAAVSATVEAAQAVARYYGVLYDGLPGDDSPPLFPQRLHALARDVFFDL